MASPVKTTALPFAFSSLWWRHWWCQISGTLPYNYWSCLSGKENLWEFIILVYWFQHLHQGSIGHSENLGLKHRCNHGQADTWVHFLKPGRSYHTVLSYHLHIQEYLYWLFTLEINLLSFLAHRSRTCLNKSMYLAHVLVSPISTILL